MNTYKALRMYANAGKQIFGVMGPSTGGKSTMTQEMLIRFPEVFTHVSFADYLKEVATRRGWNGQKDPAGRAFLQRVSEDLKAEFGDSVFYDIGIKKACCAKQPFVIIDDLRFTVEISQMYKGRHTSEFGDGYTTHCIVLEEQEAEARWEAAYFDPEDTGNWARHASELEWRAVRHMFPCFTNKKELGVEINAEVFLDFITENARRGVAQCLMTH